MTMAQEAYQKRLERHLAEYKKHRLGVRANGEFIHNGVAREYGHILPPEIKWLNIPEPFRREVYEYLRVNSHIRPHKYFHHLNSSQAFALALFYPYLTRAPGVLAKAVGVAAPADWTFEAVPDASEGTNVDVWLTARGVETFCEVKLSEREFGAAKSDAKHREKLATIYAPVLRGQVDDRLLEEPAFFKHHQILRNLWLAARRKHENDQVVFLMPRANAGLTAQLDTVLRQVGKPLRVRVRIVYVEALLERLAAERSARGLGWYAQLLREKYVPAWAPSPGPSA
jgi:hypothetical protein